MDKIPEYRWANKWSNSIPQYLYRSYVSYTLRIIFKGLRTPEII